MKQFKSESIIETRQHQEERSTPIYNTRNITTTNINQNECFSVKKPISMDANPGKIIEE